MLESLLDGDDDDAARLLAVDGEALFQRRIDADRGAAIDAIGLVGAGSEEDDPDLRILEKVLHPVDAVVAGPVGNEQGLAVVLDLDKARRIALGRAIEAMRSAGREHEKGRGRDEGAAQRVDMVDLFVDDALIRLGIERRQFLARAHELAFDPIHRRLPFPRSTIAFLRRCLKAAFSLCPSRGSIRRAARSTSILRPSTSLEMR